MPPVRLKEGIDMDELKGDGSFFELQDFNPKGGGSTQVYSVLQCTQRTL